jgi:hypothetical protein
MAFAQGVTDFYRIPTSADASKVYGIGSGGRPITDPSDLMKMTGESTPEAAFSKVKDVSAEEAISKGIKMPDTTQAQVAKPTMDTSVLGKALDQMRTKLSANNDLQSQKATILKQLYDRPLTAEEKRVLTPSQVSAIDSGNRALVDMEVRLINDQMQNRTNTLDTSINYMTKLYQDEQTRIDTQKKEAQATLEQFVASYGSNAKQALTSLYGEEKVKQIEEMTGVDLSGTMPKTLAQIEQEESRALQERQQTFTESQAGKVGVSEQLAAAQAGYNIDTSGKITTSATVNIPATTLAGKNNNPGNLRFVGQAGASQGVGGFARFDSPEAGYQALINQIQLDASRGLTVSQFINKYAPPSENATTQYVSQFNAAVGSSSNDKLSSLDIGKVAEFMAMKESGTKITGAPTAVTADIEVTNWAKNINAGKAKLSDVPSNLKSAVSTAMQTVETMSEVTPEAKEKANNMLGNIKDLQAMDWGKAVGPQISALPSYLKSGEANAISNKIKTIQGILTIENMGLMKGVLSDSDMKIITSASTSLNPNTDKKSFDAELKKIKYASMSVVNSSKLTPGQFIKNGDGTYSYKNMDGTVHTGELGDNYVDKTVSTGAGASDANPMGLDL